MWDEGPLHSRRINQALPLVAKHIVDLAPSQVTAGYAWNIIPVKLSNMSIFSWKWDYNAQKYI